MSLSDLFRDLHDQQERENMERDEQEARDIAAAHAPAHSFQYVDCDVPEGMTLREYARTREMRSRIDHLAGPRVWSNDFHNCLA